MVGFKVIFKGKEINIAPDFDAGILIYNRNENEYYISALGLQENLDNDSITHTWIDSEMNLGESVEIEIAEIDKCSSPILTFKSFSNPKPLTNIEIKNMLDEKLEDYYLMERVLKKEGLIE